jgi:hypothetical protein
MSVKRKEFSQAELTALLPLVLPIVCDLRQATLDLYSAGRDIQLLARKVQQRRGQKTRADYDLDTSLRQRQDACREAIRNGVEELSRLGADWDEKLSAALFPDAQFGGYKLIVDPFTDYSQGYVLERKWCGNKY